MIKSFSLLIFLLGITFSISAQHGMQRKIDTFIFSQESEGLLDENNNNIDISNVKGNPYDNYNFIPGTIYKDSLKEAKLLRYNIFSDEIEINTNNTRSSLLKSTDLYCKIGHKEYHFFENFGKNGIQKGYLQLLEKGKISLYLRKDCKYLPERPGFSILQEDEPAEFKTTLSYYILKNGKLILVPQRKKLFLALFSDHSSAIKKFISSKKLNIRKPKDLVKIIAYYNTL